MPGVQLYSFAQRDPAVSSSTLSVGLRPIIDLADRLEDFDDTAAVVSQLDLIISCDSALVHLAGGLGVNTWIAVPFSPDWRWLLNREDSPWYPSVRLFRQCKLGDWDEVLYSASSTACKKRAAGPCGGPLIGLYSSNFAILGAELCLAHALHSIRIHLELPVFPPLALLAHSKDIPR